MTKGFKDKDGKFRPTDDSSNGVSSDEFKFEKIKKEYAVSDFKNKYYYVESHNFIFLYLINVT